MISVLNKQACITRCQQTVPNKTGVAKLYSCTCVLCLKGRRENSPARHLHTFSSWAFPHVSETFLDLNCKHRPFIILAERNFIHFIPFNFYLPQIIYLFIWPWHMAFRIFQDQVLNPGPQQWKHWILTTGPGIPWSAFLRVVFGFSISILFYIVFCVC